MEEPPVQGSAESVERAHSQSESPPTALASDDKKEQRATEETALARSPSHDSNPPSPSASPPVPETQLPASCSSATSPPPTAMPAFLSALNLKPTASRLPGGPGSTLGDLEETADTASVQPSLLERYQQDPGSVLELLHSALSMDKLTALVKVEYRDDRDKLESLRKKLEEAYEMLQACGDKKRGLTIMVEETSDRIRTKRRQLEDIREELRELGEDELRLKKRRDESASKCLEIRRKLLASREAMQQISDIASKKRQDSSTSVITSYGTK